MSKKEKIKNVCSIIPGFAFKSNDFWSWNNIAIKIKDIQPPYINYKEADMVCVKPKDENLQLRKWDFVMAMTGATIWKVWYLPDDVENVFINQRVCKFIEKEWYDHKYLYYVLTLKSFQNFILSNVDSSSAQPNISHHTVWNYEHIFPDLEEQEKIGKVLSSIDDKIELNNKINSELEAMAKELYEYRFLQFDFPDENGKPYKSSGWKMVWNEELKTEIPEGWSVENIFSAVDVLYGYPFSTELFTEERTEKPLVRIRDILEWTNSAYTTENVDETYKLSKWDLIVWMDGNFHINYRCDDTSYLNQRCVRFRKKQDGISMLLLMFQITPFIKMREKTAKGSTVWHLSDKDVKSINVLIPNIDCKIFDWILRELVSNRIENKQLTELRDFLLPMLMNGQVTVK